MSLKSLLKKVVKAAKDNPELALAVATAVAPKVVTKIAPKMIPIVKAVVKEVKSKPV